MFGRPAVQVGLAILSVAILLLSSSDLANLRLPSNGATVDTSGPGVPPLPFLPYVIDPSQFPVPGTLLATLGNLSNPHLLTTSDQNQTIFELTYTQTDPNGSNASVMYTVGRYDPGLAVCILSPTNCSGQSIPRTPINWSAPVTLLSHILGLTHGGGLQISVGASGSIVAVATSEHNETNVSISSDFGINTAWTSITPVPVPGGSPRIAVSPCDVLLTTMTTGGELATTFDLPCGPPQTPALTAGGGTEIRLGPGASPSPFVSAVNPSSGNAGSPVTIIGGNFASGATVSFGSIAGWTVQYVSSTQLDAVAPAGTGTVDVTVTVGGQTSAIVGGDQFTYIPPSPPAVEAVLPSTSLPNTFVNVTGANFDPSASVLFGGRMAPQTAYISSTDLMAQVPWGIGSVDVQVMDQGLLSTINPGDVFSFGVQTATLPASVSASPLLAPNFTSTSNTLEGLVATETANLSVVYERSTNGGLSYTTSFISHFATSTGSPLLSTLGTTGVFLGQGIPGETAALSVGPLVFALYTTQLENRTVIETSASSNGGQSWNGPYPTAPLIGTVRDPSLATAPNGYVYATWLENGAGDWQVDQAVFAESGQLLYGPTPIPDSDSGSASPITAPTLTVDGWARPIYVWAEMNSSTSMTELRFTGAFVSAGNVAADLASAFGRTASEPWNFAVQGGPQTAFESEVNANISSVQALLGGNRVCTIQSKIVKTLGPELSTNVLEPVIPGVANYCGVTVPPEATKVVNATGPGAADVYLGVYLAWLAEAAGYAKVKEPFWPGAPGNPDANNSPPYDPGAPFYAPDQAGKTTGQGYSFQVDPVTVNPNTLWLNVTGTAPPEEKIGNETSCSKLGEGTGNITTTYDDRATAQWATISVSEGAYGRTNLLVHGFWESTYLTDLVPGTEGTWSMTVNTNYSETRTIKSTCQSGSGTSTEPIGFTNGMPQHFSATVSGSFTTVEETVPGGLVVHEVGNKTQGGNAFDYLAWNNSVVGWSKTTVKGVGYSANLGTFRNATAENTGLFAIPLNNSYTVWANLTSEDGGTNVSWSGVHDAHLNGGVTSPAESGSSSCSFVESPNPIKITWQNPSRISNVTTSSATLTWFSNQPGRGWATYNATEDGAYTQTAFMINETAHPVVAGYPYQFQLEVNGLSPWNVYRVTVGVSAYNGCLEFDNGVAWNVQVLSLVQPQEMDYPYDSITQEGGGARVTWTVPSKFAAAARFDEGSMTYCQWVSNACAANSTVVIPIDGLSPLNGGSQFTFSWVNDTFQVNLTALTLNATYNVTILLNYTLSNAPFVAQSEPYFFHYERDTSGDGLTDWEKLRGWDVTWQKNDSFYTKSVWANPALYATNGLTSDYFEKEFGLNPWTVSTTNDSMLDTWNLTFDLGAGSPSLPASGFAYWYENTSYNFSRACPDPNLVAPCSFTPVTGGGNLTDNGPGSSEIRWNSTGPQSALARLQGLIMADRLAPMRAVTGHYGSDRTITVWGKLSWGADPLAYSTSHYKSSRGSEVADGAMVNPLGYADLNVTLDSWSMSGLSNGDGVAAFIHATSAATANFPNGRVDYSSYSLNSSSPGGGDSYYGTFSVNFPAESDEQFASLNLSMYAAESGGSHLGDGTPTVAVDLWNTSGHYVRFWGNNSSQNYTLNLTYRVTPVFSKASTTILVPGDNSTFSGLPLGLDRYTGEQNFILLVLNDTVGGTGDTLTSTNIPYVNSTAPNGTSTASYTVGLTAGLNNFLVPRSLFKDSPLGEALLNMTFQNVTGRGFQRGLNNSFEPGYWIARVTGTVFGGTNYSFQDDPGGYIKVYSNESQNCTQGAKCGGVPSNPAIEANFPSYAVGAIFTLNVSTAADLNDLLAGLVLNVSGNFTNWALAATPYLRSLGLSNEVLTALANPVFFNDGGYGTPEYSPPPPSPEGWQKVGAIVWNAVSGVVGLVSAAWNWVAAAASFAAYIADALVMWGLGVLSQTVSTLKEVAGAIVWVLERIVNAILLAVKSLIQVVSDAIGMLASGYAVGIAGALALVLANLTASTPSASSIMGSIGYLLLSLLDMSWIANAVSRALSVAMSVLKPVFELVEQNRVVQVIGSAFGSSVPPGTVNSILQGTSGIAVAAAGLVADGLTSLAGVVLDGSYVPTLPQGLPSFPSGTEINSDGNAVVSWGNGLSGDFGHLLSQAYNIDDISEIVHVALIIGVLVFLLLNNAVVTSLPDLQDMAAAYVDGFGGQAVSFGNLPEMIAAEMLGVFVSVISLALSSILNWVYQLIIEVVGAGLAFYSMLRILTNPASYPAGGGFAVPLLSVASFGVSVVPPLYTGLSHD